MPQLCSILLAVGFLAQTQTPATGTRPDFSGRWADPPAAPAQPGQGRAAAPGPGQGRAGGGPAAPAGMGSGWISPFTITQTEKQLTVEYSYFSRGDMQPPLKHVFALDGSKTESTLMMGRGPQVQITTASWDGAKLVLKTTHNFSDPSTGKPMSVDVTQTLSLDSPTTLIVETVRGGAMGGQPTSTKSTYQKQQ